jgi:phage shock protein C
MNDQSPAPAYSYSTPARRLVRRHDDRMLGGVCSGIADYLRVDVTLVRVLAVVGACLGMGSLVVAYLVAWLLLPEE